MSALARWFAGKGVAVSGYDRTLTGLTAQLEAEGMRIHFMDDPGLIPELPDLVVYTPAIPQNHREYLYFRESGVTMMKRAEVLGRIASGYPTIAVAGTHGKTTTSTMIAHLLIEAGYPVIAFLGGISVNYGTNFLRPGNIPSTIQPFCIAEADEYDRSFLHLEPDLAVITSTDPDHLDIYDNTDNLTESFALFAGRLRTSGTLFFREGIRLQPPRREATTTFSYALSEPADFTASEVRQEEGRFTFTLKAPGRQISNLTLGLPGRFNLENAVAACAVAIRLGIDEDSLARGLRSFAGVRRRFEYRINTPALTYIDDYAHHPEELRACISAVKEIFPGRKITGIFQPHLYSRTRDLADDFARSLELLDELILMEIYPARELPIPGVNSTWLLEKIRLNQKRLLTPPQILELLAGSPPEVLLTLGAGDIDQLADPITKLLNPTKPL